MVYHKTIRLFCKENLSTLILFIVISIIHIPVQSVGFSTYITKIVTHLKQRGGRGKTTIDTKKLTSYICIIAGIFLLTNIVQSIKYYYEVLINSHLVKTVRTEIFNDLLNKYETKYVEVETGKTMSYFNLLPHLYEDVVYRIISYVLPYGVAIVCLLFYFIYVDKTIGCALWIIMIISGAVFLWGMRRLVNANIQKYTRMYENNEKINDKFSNIFTIITNNNQDIEKRENEKKENRYREIRFNGDKEYVRVEAVSDMMICIGVLVILYLYLQKFKKDTSTLLISSFLVFFNLISFIQRIKWQLIDSITKIYIIRNYETKNLSSTKDSSSHDRDRSPSFKQTKFIHEGHIHIQGLSYSHDTSGGAPLFKKLSHSFEPNTITLIQGRSGSGKTTLIRLLLGIYPLQQGDITYDGTSIRDADLKYLRDQIALVSQETKLFNESIAYNILYGTKMTKSRLHTLIQDLGLRNTVFKHVPQYLDTRVGVQGSHLSHGQRQVVLILRAYCKNTKIMLLDEPTASLDEGTTQWIVDLLEKIKQTRTVIVVTHDKLSLKAKRIHLTYPVPQPPK